MRALLQLSLLATSLAFVIPNVKFAVPARAKLVLSEVDECIVDAENAAELAACKDEAPVTPPAASGKVVDECIVNAYARAAGPAPYSSRGSHLGALATSLWQ